MSRSEVDLLVLDGRHLLWRTSDAFRDLVAEVDGETIPTGGMYGFLSVAIRIRQRYTGRAVVAWEGKNNFRLSLYPKYKGKDEEPTAERLEMISEMTQQERRLSELLTVMGVDQYSGKGCEADDVIGRLAREARERGERVVLYSGDSDLRQLVCDKVTAVSPGMRGPDAVYNEAAVEARHHVPPNLLAQLKAVAGDASDNIPGARGIGPVTAAKLLNHFGSLNVLLEAAEECADSDWPSTPRHKRLIQEAADDIRLYYKLTRIRTNKPWIRRAGRANQQAVVDALVAYKFRSLIAPAELHALMSLGKAR